MENTEDGDGAMASDGSPLTARIRIIVQVPQGIGRSLKPQRPQARNFMGGRGRKCGDGFHSTALIEVLASALLRLIA